MALWPPGLPYPFAPPPPPRWLLSPPQPWWPSPSTPSSRGHDSSSSPGGVVAGVVIGLVASLLAFAIMCALCQGHRNNRASAAAATAAAARLRAPPQTMRRGGGADDERQHLRSSAIPSAPPWPDSTSSASPTAGLPAFTYSPSVKRNVSGDDGEEEGEEAAAAATCSVCLGAFQIGETVRLLPACLHLYHAECIDPWLDAHTTCPLCRSDTDPSPVDTGRLPPV